MRMFICFYLFGLVPIHSLFAQQIDLNSKVSVMPVTGKKFSLQQLRENKASVIIFYSPECPICISMTKSVREMADSFGLKGAKFYLVYPGTYYSKTHIRKFQQTYQLKPDGFRDDSKTLAKLLGATVTPQAFIIDSLGNIVYSGKIDNWFVDIGNRRTIITEFYLRDALSSLLSHRKITVKKTEPVGCFIE